MNSIINSTAGKHCSKTFIRVATLKNFIYSQTTVYNITTLHSIKKTAPQLGKYCAKASFDICYNLTSQVLPLGARRLNG